MRQYQYTAWPDHDVPCYPLSLVKMMKEIDNYQKSRQMKQSPIVLHCSAGIGRSGTVALLWSAIQMAEAEKKVDIVTLLYKLREQRINLVENEEQYRFAYRALVDWLFADRTWQESNSMVLYFNKLRKQDPKTRQNGLQVHFEKLKSLDCRKTHERFATAKSACNKSKNRNPEILPPDDGRPILKTDPPNNYINAVYVHDYSVVNEYVVTQYPMENTINDFWQLAWDLNINTVVVLNEISRRIEESPEFWPTTENSKSFGNFKVQNLQSEPEYTNGVLRMKLKLKDKSDASNSSRKLKMFLLYGWGKNDIIPPRIDFVVHMFLSVQQWRNKTGHKPTLVTCFNGSTSSGFYCAVSILAGQLMNSKFMDVFHAVRTIRVHRPNFIPTVEQYRWLYEAACFLATNIRLFK